MIMILSKLNHLQRPTSRYNPKVEATCFLVDLTPTCNGICRSKRPPWAHTDALSPLHPAHCPTLQVTTVPTLLWCLPILIPIYLNTGTIVFWEEKESEIFVLIPHLSKVRNVRWAVCFGMALATYGPHPASSLPTCPQIWVWGCQIRLAWAQVHCRAPWQP